MKKIYEKPSMEVVKLQHHACLLQESEPDGVKEFDDWLD